MNILKKSTAILFLLPVLMMTGCNGLQNEKEVKLPEYFAKTATTLGKNEYPIAHATFKLEEGDNKVNEAQDFTWDKEEKDWVPATETKISFEIEHASASTVQIAAAFAAAGIKDPEMHYYVADNGFRITGKGSIQLAGGSAKLEVEQIFNQYGYVTSAVAKGEAVKTLASGNETTKVYSELKVSYGDK